MQRGTIRNRERAKQLRDFSGLRFGKITPTDIDGYLEFSDILFILIEAKRSGAALPYGQRLALERACDAIHGTINGKGIMRLAAILIVEHNTLVDQDVDYANTHVISVRYNYHWQAPQAPITLREAIERLCQLAHIRI